MYIIESKLANEIEDNISEILLGYWGNLASSEQRAIIQDMKDRATRNASEWGSMYEFVANYIDNVKAYMSEFVVANGPTWAYLESWANLLRSLNHPL